MTQKIEATSGALLRDAPVIGQVAAVALGTLFLAASSQFEVPMVPVPMNMQTFAVLLIGVLYGPALGFATVLAWLGEAAIGLPVLSGGAGGPAHFVGPTAGYLLGFALAAPLVGWLMRHRGGRSVLRSFAAMMLGHAAILLPGVLWLSAIIGFGQAVTLGFNPFIVGTLLKSALAAACAMAAERAVVRCLDR